MRADPARPAPGARAGLLLLLLAAAPCCGREPAERTVERPPAAAGAGTAGHDGPAAQAAAEEGTTGEDASLEVTLFFADESGSLRSEVREVPRAATPARQARRVVEALMQGPESRSLFPTLPPASGVREVYLRPDGTAYVDMDASFARGLSQGSRDALLAVWSLANTLAVNFDEVRRVKILIEGEEVQDLGGHLDLSRPFLPDMSLVAGPGGGGSARRPPGRAEGPRRASAGSPPAGGAP